LIAQASYVREINESVPLQESRPTMVKRAQPSHPVNVIISVKTHAKKAKTTTVDGSPIREKSSTENPLVKHDSNNKKDNNPTNKIIGTNDVLGALVSYSDESDDDDN
jgi:hypothetical protein